MKKKKYTVEEYLKAAEIGEVSMIDAKHVCSLLDEARSIINNEYDCHNCKHSFSNPFDQYYCNKGFDLESDVDCNGTKFKK